MADNRTRLQKLSNLLINSSNGRVTPSNSTRSVTYNITPSSEVIYSTDSKEDRDKKLMQLRQERFLASQWAKTSYESSMDQLNGANQVKVMYRDADLMAAWPEIGSALDTISEEATTINKKGKILNIYSSSERIKSVLEDLFINRLDINVWSRTIARATAKYGNEFMFLNIHPKEGVLGWRELNVHEMSRLENGMQSPYGGYVTFAADASNIKPDDVKFVWEGHTSREEWKSWQVAHFRLINDSLYLPYGVSWLNKARRHWRMLSMMEDAMLLYRLERSVERRIFKVNVGLIDDKDVPAFLQEFMNGVKRAPIIDPQTGQMDLRKNFLDVSADYVIPVRSGQDPTSIETLPAAQNPTTDSDIQFMQEKVLCALRVPRQFIEFKGTTSNGGAKGKNLSQDDIRFCRAINGLQQSLILELNKIAIIHLYLLGFEDDLTNFTISFNNPSDLIEMMELDNLMKRITTATSALAEQACGIPLMSWHKAQKEIMGLTDAEISELLDEIRIESALSIELQKTFEIIKQTHIFDKVDRIYGEPGAKYSAGSPQEGGIGGVGGGGGGMPPMPGEGFGDELGDLGEPGSDDIGNIGGEEGSQDLGSMGGEEGGQLNESLINSLKSSGFYKNYIESRMTESVLESNKRPSIESKALLINEGLDSMIKGIDLMLEKSSVKEEDNIIL